MLSVRQRLSIPRSGGEEVGLTNYNDAALKMGKLLFVTALCAIAMSVLLWLALSFMHLLSVDAHGMHQHDGDYRPPKNDTFVLMSVDSVSGGMTESEPLGGLLSYLYSQDSQYCTNILPQDEGTSLENRDSAQWQSAQARHVCQAFIPSLWLRSLSKSCSSPETKKVSASGAVQASSSEHLNGTSISSWLAVMNRGDKLFCASLSREYWAALAWVMPRSSPQRPVWRA